MAKRKKKKINISDEEKEFLMEQNNVLTFAAGKNGPFSDLVLSINFLKSLAHNLESVNDSLSNQEQLKQIMQFQQLTPAKWVKLLKKSLPTNDAIMNMSKWKEVQSILDNNDLSLKKFLAYAIKEEVSVIKPQLNWLGSYVNDNIRELRQEADKLSSPGMT